jgi:hypothetical protein
MKETLFAVLLKTKPEVLLQLNGSEWYIDDDPRLWRTLTDNKYRGKRFEVAHTHPEGIEFPSSTDRVTFATCNRGLGHNKTVWSIVTPTTYRRYKVKKGVGLVEIALPEEDPTWLSDLRKLSYGEYT